MTFFRDASRFLMVLVVASAMYGRGVRAQETPVLRAPQSTNASDASLKTPAGKMRFSEEVQITGDQLWVDTAIDVRAGEHIFTTATGKLRYADAKADSDPDGLARGFKDLIRSLPLNQAGRGALIGHIGDAQIAAPFLLGVHRDLVAAIDGRLFIGINQAANDVGEGTYKIGIEIYEPDASFARVAAREVKYIRGVDSTLFSKIPRRIVDKDGHPGDMVNFVIIGSEEAMKNIFTTAGWVAVDADVRGTFLHGLIESLSKESYLTMPMSQLYLFGRPQDYGWAHAEPIKVVSTRNHLRVWRAPSQVEGETLWVGAATHDIGFERDERNNRVTHKIDPDIDLERDFVEKTLLSTGLVAEFSHFAPQNPLKEAHTATGGTFHSNGEIVILKLAPFVQEK